MGNNIANFSVQQSSFDTESTRSQLDQLLSDSKLYQQSKDYKDLLDFVTRLRNFAPFNAMLLQVQKPGLSYAASAQDWGMRFGRWPKEGARPLLILWPFGPVALVYDVLDTEGRELPGGVASFSSHGVIDEVQVTSFRHLIDKKNIECFLVDAGDQNAGSIRVVKRTTTEKETTLYRMSINRNHTPAVQFATIAHELGHLFLGHLGFDKKLKVPKRQQQISIAQKEFEAESVAYIVCERNGITSKSESYLTHYVDTNTTIENIDIYQVMRAAGRVETLLGISGHTKY